MPLSEAPVWLPYLLISESGGLDQREMKSEDLREEK